MSETRYAPDGLERCCPDALVRRITETDHYVLNHQPTGPVATRVFYECAACGRRLREEAQPTPPASSKISGEAVEKIARAFEAQDVYARILQPTPPAEGAPNRFRCTDCGIVAVQEDGTCKHCGSDTTPVYVPPTPPAEGEAAEALMPTEAPADPTIRGRLMLNAYGRQCWQAGYDAAKAEGETPEGLSAEARHLLTLAAHRIAALETENQRLRSQVNDLTVRKGAAVDDPA